MSIRDVCSEIERLINSTEEVYAVVFERFPRMERSLELSTEETRILLDYFIRTRAEEGETGPGDSEKNFRLTEILNEIGTNVEMVDQSLLNREEINELLHAFMEAGENDEVSIDQLLGIVKIIDKALSDIDLVSLNAIIFAGRLGEEGAPFSVIAERIKDLSQKVAERNSRVQELITSLQQWLDDFRENIDNLLNFRDKITEEHAARVKERFQKAVESMGEIGAQLYDLLNNVSYAIEPGKELMVLIQNQDIIRQEMENLSQLMNSLEEQLVEYGSSPSSEEKVEVLDQVTFRYDAIYLASKLMGNIREQLKESVGDISERLEDLEYRLEQICEDSYYLSEFFGGSSEQGQEGRGAVDETFSEISSFIDEFLNSVDELSSRSVKLTSDRKNFVEMLDKTDDLIEGISKQLDGLKKLRILSTIELSRLSMEEHSFNRDIERITEEVMRAISDNKKQYRNLKSTLEKNLELLENTMLNSRDRVENAKSVVYRTREELSTTNEVVNQAIHALHSELTKLHEEISATKEEFQPAVEFEGKSEEILNQIQDLLEKAREEKQYYLDYYGEEDWEEKNEKYAGIIDSFTTYAERVTARQVLHEEDLEESDKGGELTLF